MIKILNNFFFLLEVAKPKKVYQTNMSKLYTTSYFFSFLFQMAQQNL
jgi:hypothetical protein